MEVQVNDLGPPPYLALSRCAPPPSHLASAPAVGRSRERTPPPVPRPLPGPPCTVRVGTARSSLPSLPRAATDHNVDNTTAVLKEWLAAVQPLYHYVEWRPLDQPT